MQKSLFHLMILMFIICIFPFSSFAQTGWVSDMLLLTFRQGPGNNYAVLKTLKSNTPVSIIEEQDGFYKVELQSNEIGWVDKKFIMLDPPKAILLDQLEKENKTLENKISKLEGQAQSMLENSSLQKDEASQKIISLEASLNTALDEKNKLDSSLSEAKAKYNTLIDKSKNIQKIVEENKQLQKQNAVLSKDLEALTSENQDLFKTSMIKWFLAGIGTLLLGWIIGRSVSSKRRTSSLLD